MRGEDLHQDRLYSYVSPEQRVPADHPLRAIRRMANTVLERLSPQLDALYSAVGRPSIPPEKLLRALLLQVLYTLRSERLLMEELDYNLLFRWFVGLNMDDPVWDATVYCKNRERLLKGEVADAFFKGVLQLAEEHHLLSDEHFTVDGTLIEAWASLKSFKKKDTEQTTPPPEDPGNPTVNFHGEERSNETHQSTTDPEARLYRKGPGKEAKLNYMGHVLMENRNGLAVQSQVTKAMTPKVAWPTCAPPVLPRTWRRTPPGAEAVRLMDAPRVTGAMTSVSACARRACGEHSAWAGCSLGRWRPT